MTNEKFEPRVLAFCCHYCAYAAADLAGTMRIQYPPNVRIIRTPCTGRLETEYFLKALENGADGVLIAGCLEGGCHFTSGNLYAKRRVNYVREILAEMGFEKERLRMVNISAAMARPLADAIIDMVETVRKLGPNPITLRIDDGGLRIVKEAAANPKSEIRNPKLEKTL
jgi:coenzyme F420-reducing hydrogenase delta subunit